MWNFVRNVWRYRKWLAHDADFDWSYLAEIMEIKLRAMSEHFRDHGIVEGSDEMAAETKEAADILYLMRGGESGIDLELSQGYIPDIYNSLSEEEATAVWGRVHAAEEANRKRFSELMSKIEWWWD